ncbi:MAG: hypothetical protein JXB05_05750 [Myxococcaceae bacterium]|nr:hypothetical protein [Myxococcaceae bacterium]
MRLAAVLALAALAAGCSGCSEKKGPHEASAGNGGTAGTTERLSPLRAGVKVPLPPGWSALVAADGSFQAGPPGVPVLRVDVRRGEGGALPSAEELADSVRERFSQFQVSLEQQEGDEQLSLVRITLAPKREDGGAGPHATVMLGARRVGEDLFLCATLPGASAEEVRLATEACREIQPQATPR